MDSTDQLKAAADHTLVFLMLLVRCVKMKNVTTEILHLSIQIYIFLIWILNHNF